MSASDPNEPRVCPLCPEETGPQPAENFGICRARKDGRNLYCRVCIARKVKRSREAGREYQQTLKRLREDLPAPAVTAVPRLILPRPTVESRVIEAIRLGNCTYEAIEQHTKLMSDEIGVAIANLLLHDRAITTRMHPDGWRIYELAGATRLPVIAEPVSPRQPDARSDARSLTLTELMIKTA